MDNPADGMFLEGIRWFFRCKIFNYSLNCYAWYWFCRHPSDYKTRDEVNVGYRRLLDGHVWLWLRILCICFIVAWGLIAIWNSSYGCKCVKFLVAVLFLGIISLTSYRFLQILSVWVQLHLNSGFQGYEPKSKARSIVHCFIHAVEFMVGFASVHLILSVISCDPYTDDCAVKTAFKSFVDPLYFSSTTLFTVGYGDIAPQNVFGRFVVIVQEFFGLLLFGVIVQRVMSSEEKTGGDL